MGARRGGSTRSGAVGHRFDPSHSDEGSSRRIASIVPIEPGLRVRLMAWSRFAASGSTHWGGVSVVPTRESGEPGDSLIDQGMPATFQTWIVGRTREMRM